MGRWDRELIEQLPKSVKVSASAGAGFDWVDTEILAESGECFEFHDLFIIIIIIIIYYFDECLERVHVRTHARSRTPAKDLLFTFQSPSHPPSPPACQGRMTMHGRRQK